MVRFFSRKVGNGDLSSESELPTLRSGGDLLNLHLAGNLWHKWDDGLFDPILTGGGLLILESFYYCDSTVEKMIPYFEKFMLDSGAFTMHSKGKIDNLKQYINDYVDFINRNNVELFIEFDIDKLIGYDNVKKIRSYLEKKTGTRPIPVWHKHLGKAEFENMVKEYDYIAIGGMTKRREITPYLPWFIDKAHENDCKIHGLGFTALKDLANCHFDSVDSTAWLSGNRFGSIYQFTGKTMVKYDKKAGQKLSDSRAVAIHNFTEWAKFQQYAKENL